VGAFAYFGGVPWQILYDNTKLVVAKILGDGERNASVVSARNAATKQSSD